MRSDEELMLAYVAGDRAAFRELFTRYAPLLERLMQRGLYAREEARDLVQQTFLQVHRARHDYDPHYRVRPWIYTIALNLKREHFRWRKRRPTQALDNGPEPDPVPPHDPELHDDRRRLLRALGALRPDQREVIELHWFHGLSFPEVAECVGTTPTAAKVRAHRGYQKLREILGGNRVGPRA